jgi:hypothetical protein
VPFEIVHLKLYVPADNPVTVDVGLEVFVIVGVLGPVTKDHTPRPIVGVLAASVIDDPLHII